MHKTNLITEEVLRYREARAKRKAAKAKKRERKKESWRENYRLKDDAFFKSKEWRELRYKALVLHGARCQCCGASSKDGVVIHVDHIKPRSKWSSLELSLDNLQLLCADCNYGKSNIDVTDWRAM